MEEKIRNIIENLDWTIYEDEEDIEFKKYSPLGEDFIFSIKNNNNIVEQIIDYANNFDEYEHAEMYIDIRGQRGVPNSIKDLIEDAQEIKNMLLELANALKENNIQQKYYIEIAPIDDITSYVIQSKWYNTKKEAIKWTNTIDYLNIDYKMYLMSGEYNTIEDTYTNIQTIKELN